MLRGDHHVLRARVLGDVHPLFGAEINRIELLGVLVVCGLGNLKAMPCPLMAADHRIGAPMEEDAEFGFLKPRQPLGFAERRLRGLGQQGKGEEKSE